MSKVNLENKRVLFPMLMGIAGAIIMLISLILPYASATEEQAKKLEKNADKYVYEELDMKSEDIINVSMVQYARIYTSLSEQIWGDSASGILYVVFVALIGVFSLLALFMTVKKKPVGTIIFAVLALIVFLVQNWDYTDRGVIPSKAYDWGIAYYMCYIGSILMLVGAVWMFVCKKKAKKESTVATDASVIG